MSEHEHHCGGCGKLLTIRCDSSSEHQLKAAGSPETTEEEVSRVIEIVVADLKANGKIRMAILGL